MLDYSEYAKILIGLLAIINPIGAIPICMSMTGGASPRQRRQLARVVSLSVAIILFTALLLGERLLAVFGISIDSFRVAGGILVLLMAISMLHARQSEVRQTEQEADESTQRASVAVVPLAMPLLAGPGAISTVILYAHRGGGFSHYAAIGANIVLVSLLLWALLTLVPLVSRHVTQTGINIFTRVMGLILAAIAVEFLANGLKGLFPALAN
jgi:multiple antibiotic resistance protein